MPADTGGGSRKRKASDNPSLEAHREPGAEPKAKARNTSPTLGGGMCVFVIDGVPDEEHGAPEECCLPDGGTAVVVAESVQKMGDILFQELFPKAASQEDEQVVEEVTAEVAKRIEKYAEISLEQETLFELTNGVPAAAFSSANSGSADARVERRKMRVFLFKNFKTQGLRQSAALVLARSPDAARQRMIAYVADVATDMRPVSGRTTLRDEGHMEEVDIEEPGFYHLHNGVLYSS